tara:strand:- start:556 stop:1071 length:516 start_codon:yes stop_codon:yes gene_type:complete
MGFFDFLNNKEENTSRNIRNNIKSENGLNQIYYENSANLKYEFYRKNGKINGTYKKYDTAGNLISEVNYDENLKNGTYRGYNPLTGKVDAIGNYVNGVKDGIWKWTDRKTINVTEIPSSFNDGNIRRHHADFLYKKNYDMGIEKWVKEYQPKNFKGWKGKGGIWWIKFNDI